MIFGGRVVTLCAAVVGDGEVGHKEMSRREFFFLMIVDWLWKEKYSV